MDVSCRGGFLRIRICDNGCGIERERLREIWLGNDEKRRGHTTGIGLSNIAARIGCIREESAGCIPVKVRDDCGDFIPTDDGGEE